MRNLLIGLVLLAFAPLPAGAAPDRDTELYLAVAAEDLERTRALIAQGADVNRDQRPWHLTPLLLAAERDPALARLLVAAGADINAADREQQTVLMKAVHTGNTEVVRLLLAEEGLELEARAGLQANTALTYAVMWGRPDIVKLLLDAGADVNVVRVNGTTPLSLARHMVQRAHAMPGAAADDHRHALPHEEQHVGGGLCHHQGGAAHALHTVATEPGEPRHEHAHHGHGTHHAHGDHGERDYRHAGHDAHGHRLRTRAVAIREHELVLALLEEAGARLEGAGEAPAHHHHH